MKQIAQVTGRLRAIRLALGVIIALVWLPCALAQKFPSPISAVLIERGPLQQIDLTSTLSPGVSNLNLLAARFKLPGGRLTNDGVIFRLGGALAVTGMEAAQDGEFYPAHSPRVAVKAGAPRLHLLLGADHTDRDGVPLAKLVIHYATGEQRAVRLAYGVHVRSWLKDRREKKGDPLDANSRIAWTGTGDELDRPGMGARLFRTEIENPLPAEEIASVELVSLFSRSTPFLAALTLENGAGRAPATAAGSRRVPHRMEELDDSVYHREFVVQTTDAVDGGRLTNASAALTITDDQKTFYFGEVQSDGAGVIRLPYGPQQTVSFQLLVRAAGHTPMVITASKTNGREFPKKIEAKLERGTTIGGAVRDAGGKPVGGAQIVVYNVVRASAREYTRVDHDTTTTDSQGGWSCSSLPANFTNFFFHISHPDHRPVTYRQAALTEPATNGVAAADLLARQAAMVLPGLLRLECIVSDESGKAIPAVEARVTDPGRGDSSLMFRGDDNGRVRIMVPEPMDVMFTVSAKGFAPRFQTVTVETSTSQFAITLRKTQPFKGRVLDQTGNPVPGARVRLETWNDTRMIQWQGVADTNGLVMWDSPPEGSVMFFVSAPNHGSLSASMSLPTSEHTFNIRAMSRVAGTVIDADTKQPIDEFTIIRGRAYNPDEPIRWERYNVTRGRNGQYSSRLDEYSSGRTQIMIESPGYMPQQSQMFTSAGVFTSNFELKKARGISGQLVLADGTPVPNASVLMVDRGESGYMDRSGDLRRSGYGGELQRTDARGRFEFQPRLEPHAILASCGNGFGEAMATNVVATGQLIVRPWGRVKGTVRVGRKTDPARSVVLQNHYYQYSEQYGQSSALNLQMKFEPDSDGSFIIDRVPPGERKVALEVKVNERDNGRSTGYSHTTPVTVKPGETTEVNIGGTGRPVFGRINVIGADAEDIDWRREVHTLYSKPPPVPQLPQVPPPASRGILSALMGIDTQQQAQKDYNDRQRAFWLSPEGLAAQRKERRYILLFETNGTYHIDQVEPGTYILQMDVTNPERGDNYYEYIGSISAEVTIPTAPAGKPDEPFDLGTQDLRVRNLVRVGKRAPKFTTKTFDGQTTVKLDDYKGKWVLLDFWATWGGARTIDVRMLKELHDTYSKDDRFVMIGLNVDHQKETGEQAVKTGGCKWLQCYLGPWNEITLPASYGVQGVPEAILIDPEGKIAAKNLRGSNIRTTVRNALSDTRLMLPR